MGQAFMMADYFERMTREGRLVAIKEDEKLHTFITFSMCDDHEPYQLKDLWEYLPHNPMGKICFIEKMVSKKWSKEIRQQLEEALVSRYPQIEQAIWYRPTSYDEERKVTYRRKHEASL